MRVIDRLIIFILSLLMVAAGAVSIFICFDYNGGAAMLASYIAGAFTDYRWFMLIGGALIVILGVIFIFASAFHSKREPRLNMVNSADQGDNLQISVNAIDCIIQQVAKGYAEVSSLHTKIHPAEQGINLTVSLIVDSNTNIPELSKKLQEAVKLQLETMAGLKVADVKVIISDVVQKPAE